MNLQQQIAEATANHEALLEATIAKLTKDNELRALAPEGLEPKSIRATGYDNVDVLYYDVDSVKGVHELVTAWHTKYGAFLPVGEYHKGCTTVTAYPWAEYATVGPKNVCDDGVDVSNHVGKGFNSLTLEFYPNVPGQRIRVVLSEAFRANLPGLHGHISCNYNQYGDPVLNSIHKAPPPAFKDASFTLRYGSGSDDAAHFCGVFSADRLLGALPRAEGKACTQ